MNPAKRILYVEDNEDTALLIKLMLAERGYETVIALSVAEAFNHTARSRFNLYLLDLLLPDGTGIDVCRQIRRFDTTTPVLFYSALAFKRDQDAAAAAGATGYIVKAANHEDLMDEIERLTRSNRGRVLPMKPKQQRFSG